METGEMARNAMKPINGYKPIISAALGNAMEWYEMV
jgi:hypothetical protein